MALYVLLSFILGMGFCFSISVPLKQRTHREKCPEDTVSIRSKLTLGIRDEKHERSVEEMLRFASIFEYLCNHKKGQRYESVF